MKTYTWQEVLDLVASNKADDQEDNQGQILFYTGVYRHKDGTLHDTADPNWDDE